MAYLDSDRRRGFIVSQPPLSRSTIVRLGDDLHELIWTIHHAVIDGWCLSVLLQEVVEIYESTRGGYEPGLRPVRPFRDYVAWLRDRDDAQAEGFWRQALRGVTAATPLGLERSSSHGRGPSRLKVDDRETALSSDITARLQTVGRAHRLTLSTVIQGAWALLLSRYSGRSDVLFGVTVSGRPPELPGVESIVGLFINSLPLRVEVTEAAFLIPWLSKIQATMAELRRFEAVPLSRIQTWSALPAGVPLFESIVIVQNLPFVASLQETRNRAGDRVSSLRGEDSFPAHCHGPTGHRAGDQDRFRQREFEGCAIERMLGHLRTVLEAMALEPDRRVADLPLMTETEQEQLIGPWQASHGELLLDNSHVDQFTESQLDILLDRLRSEGKVSIMLNLDECATLSLRQKRELAAQTVA